MTEDRVPLALDTERGLTLKLYERGCALLERCMTFDETKYWDSFSDAAIAWGKIHKSDRVEQLARALKLRAFRRLGEIAKMERPPTVPQPRTGAKTGGPSGRPGGPIRWLESQGMDRNEAAAARKLAGMEPSKFAALTERRRPPLPTSAFRDEFARSPWQLFYMHACIGTVASNLSRTPASEAAKLGGIDRDKVEPLARQLAQWFQLPTMLIRLEPNATST